MSSQSRTGGHTPQGSAPPGVVLDLDGDRFTQVISNLLTNAAKYTPRGSAITIASAVRPDAVELTVADDGPSEREQARRAGFAAHFTKPVDLHALLGALKRQAESRCKQRGLSVRLCPCFV